MRYRNNMAKIIRIILILLLAVSASCALIGTYLYEYIAEVFDVDLVQIVYTLRAPLKGANSDIVNQILFACMPAIVQVIAIVCVSILADYYLSIYI